MSSKYIHIYEYNEVSIYFLLINKETSQQQRRMAHG